MVSDLVIFGESLAYVCLFIQKTAYELRIRDWMSDVCASELRSPPLGGVCVTIGGREMPGGRVTGLLRREADRAVGLVPAARALLDVRRREIALARREGLRQIGRAHV